jgi:hypothetical protein
MEKELPVYELQIEQNEGSDVEVDFVALVDRPAIQRGFLAFAEDSWNDYPEAAVENAKTALRWAEENGWGDCGEASGKNRANQIANKEKLTRETIARMSAFQRHRQNSDRPLGEGCGRLMWLAWGGDEGIAWAERKLKQIDKQAFVIQDEEQRIISGPLMLADTPIYRNDAIRGEYYVVFSADTIKQIAQKFFKKGYQNNVNLMHNSGDVQEGLTMFESWIVDKKRGIQPMVGFEDVPDGSWFGSYKVENDEAWNKVKSGEVLGFSVEGNFLYKEQEQMSAEERMMNEIIKVLQQVK